MRKTLFTCLIAVSLFIVPVPGSAFAKPQTLDIVKNPSPQAVAAMARGERIPTTTGIITYYRAPALKKWDQNFRRGLIAFTPSGLRFLRVNDPKRAQIVYTFKAKTCGTGGCAEMGYQQKGPTKVWLVPKTAAKYRVAAIKHETGHALGLGHHDGSCSVMNENFNSCLKPGALAPIDRRALYRLYGPNTYTPLGNALENLSIQSSEPVGYWNVIHLRLRSRLVKTLQVTRSVGDCSSPVNPDSHVVDPVNHVSLAYTDADARGLSRYHMPIDNTLREAAPGVYCYTVWPINLHNQPGIPSRIEYRHNGLKVVYA